MLSASRTWLHRGNKFASKHPGFGVGLVMTDPALVNDGWRAHFSREHLVSSQRHELVMRYSQQIKVPEVGSKPDGSGKVRIFGAPLLVHLDTNKALAGVLEVLRLQEPVTSFRSHHADATFVALPGYHFRLSGVAEGAPVEIVDTSGRRMPIPKKFDVTFDAGHAIILRKLVESVMHYQCGFHRLRPTRSP